MKGIEELALGTADVAAITPKVISKTLEEVARGKTIFAQFFKQNRDLVGPNTPHEIVFAKKSTGITTSWGVSPGQSIAPSSFAYDAVTIRVSKGGTRLEFTNEALEAAMRDVIKDHIYEAGLQWAEQIDNVAKTVMLDIKQRTASFEGGTGTLSYTVSASYAPILEIISVNGNTIDKVDYYDGVVYFKATAPASTFVYTYAYRPNSNTMTLEVKAAKTISAWDMLQAKNKIVGNNRNPDFFLMNPADLPGLLYDASLKFLDKSAYGSSEAIVNGEIGKVFGMKVVTSTRVPEGVGIALDSSRLGYDVIKRELNGYREDKYEYDSVWYHLWTERGFGVVDDLAVAIVVGGRANLYPATIT